MKKNKNIILSAFNIHTGGGLVLLEKLLKYNRIKCTLLDLRVKNKIFYNKLTTTFVKREIFDRLLKPHLVFTKSNVDDIIICFNGLPPLFKPKGKIILFVQTFYFISNILKYNFPYFVFLRICFEKIWFRLGLRNADEVWLQTITMKKRFLRYLKKNNIKIDIKIRIMPLIDDHLFQKIAINKSNKKSDLMFRINKNPILFYPADDAKHKNHLRLLIATKFVKKNFKLCLTLDPDSLEKLYIEADFSEEEKARVINLNKVPRKEILLFLKRKTDCLIFPSLDESFGLPLLEAAIFKKSVIASNLPFIKDVIKNYYLFNPYAVRSISRAINGFLNKKHCKISKLRSLNFILSKEFLNEGSLN